MRNERSIGSYVSMILYQDEPNRAVPSIELNIYEGSSAISKEHIPGH